MNDLYHRAAATLILAWALSTAPLCAQEPDAAGEPAAPVAAAMTPADLDRQIEANPQAVLDAIPNLAQNGRWDKWNDQHSIDRSYRFTVSLLKLSGVIVLFLIWVKSADWVNQDSQIFDVGYGTWNPVICFPYAVGLVVMLFVPFVVSYPLLWVVYLITFFTYVVVRNRNLEPYQRVFTPSWIRYEFAQVAGKVGVKIEAERLPEYEKGPKVDFVPMGAGEPEKDKANLIKSRRSPGYRVLKDLIADMTQRRCESVILDFAQQSVAVRHQIDGVWHNGDARDRESSDVMLAVLKTLANLDVSERRKKQEGHFGAKFEGKTYHCPVVSQGTKSGERVLLTLEEGKRSFSAYADLGMREALREQWAKIMGSDAGLVIISATPKHGLTTLIDVSLEETDRLLRDFFAIEPAGHTEREIENIEVHTYDADKGETPATILPKLIRLYPNVYVVRDFVDAESMVGLMKEVQDERLVVTSVPAKSAPDALLRMLQKKVPAKQLAAVVTAVLNQRLIRKLCAECKVAYEPTPDLLKKLGIPAGKIKTLYRTPKQEEADKLCRACNGVGYVGRTGIHELLIVNDEIREILVKQPKMELLQKAARGAGMRSFQEEGIFLVVKGVTSLQEVMRVMKQ